MHFFVEGGAIVPVVSDPFGWGWNLFGTTGFGWTPYLMNVVPVLQVMVLIGGLIWASATARKISLELKGGLRQALPVIAFCFAATLGLLWLLVG